MCAAGRRLLLVATRQGAASGCRVGARGGSGCGPAGLVPRAAASWVDRASSSTLLETNRQGDGGALGPHIVERGGIQIERRGRSLADEAVHGKHFTWEKHLLRVKWLENFLTKKNDPDMDVTFFPETNLSHDGPRRSRSKVIYFCVSMTGRGALRCKKRGVKKCAARAAQKKTCAAQRHAKWTSGEGK